MAYRANFLCRRSTLLFPTRSVAPTRATHHGKSIVLRRLPRIRRVHLRHGEHHVGLTDADPHIPKPYVIHYRGRALAFTRNLDKAQSMRPSDFLRRQVYGPLPRVYLPRVDLVIEGHPDFPRVVAAGAASQRVRFSMLENRTLKIFTNGKTESRKEDQRETERNVKEVSHSSTIGPGSQPRQRIDIRTY